MKKIIYILISISLYACSDKLQRSKEVEPPLTSELRPMSESEAALFKLAKKEINEQASFVSKNNSPTPLGAERSPITLNDESTWKTENYYVLNMGKFMLTPTIENLMTSADKPKDFYVCAGKTDNGRYLRLKINTSANNFSRTSTFQYEEILSWIDGEVKKLGGETYSVLSIFGRDYYVVESNGQTNIYRPLDEKPSNEETINFIVKMHNRPKSRSLDDVLIF